ncbi:UNVERIFIED_CONTAM: hypothetical protein Sindi_1341300, partial [Sesamum indicum]
ETPDDVNGSRFLYAPLSDNDAAARASRIAGGPGAGQGLQVPSFPPILHAVPGEPGAGIGCGLGMGISGLSSSAGFAMRQLALSSPSSLPGISEAAHNPVNILGSSPFVCSSMDLRPMYAAVFTPGSQCTATALDGSSPSSQCAMSSKSESCHVPVTGEVGSPSSCSLEGVSFSRLLQGDG